MIWQNIITTLIVLAAATWLARRIWRIVVSGSRDGAGHISSCGTCHNNPESAKNAPLVQLGKRDKPS